MNNGETVEQHGNREHLHMLGAARAWFIGKHYEEWEQIRSQSLEAGLDSMICALQLAANPPNQQA